MSHYTGTGVTLGLVAALGWGAADLLARYTGRGVGVLRAVCFAQAISLVIATAWLVVDRPDVGLATWGPWAAAIGGAAIILAGTFALYRAVTIGTVSIVVPVATSYGAVTLALSVATGEPLNALAVAGLGLAIIGVVAVSAPARAMPTTARGLRLALLAAVAFGVGFWLQGAFAVPALGVLVPVWIYYAAGSVGVALVARASGERLVMPNARLRWLLLAAGICGAGGYLAFAAGLATGHVGVVTVLSSLSSGVTVILARLFLTERLARRQWTGVVAILLGVALLHGA